MKKIKLIPALAMVAMLAGCSGNSLSVKAPKFAKEGKEVQETELADIYNADGYFGLWETVEPDEFPSFVAEAKASSEVKEKVYGADKKVKRESDNKSVSNATSKGDMKNLRLQEVVESKHIENGKADGATYKANDEKKEDVVYQYGKYEGKDYLMYIDNANNYYFYTESMEGATEADKKAYICEGAFFLMNDVIDYSLFLEALDNYEGMSEEVKSNYKFFVNGKILTISYTYEESYDYEEDGDVIYTINSKTTLKMQLDASKNENYAYRELSEIEETVEFKENAQYDYNDYFAGEKLETVRHDYFEGKVNVKDVTIKDIDLSNYFDLTNSL